MTDYPVKQFKPYGANEGEAFLSAHCATCAKDKCYREGAPVEECDESELCQIIGASFRGEAVEWRILPDGKSACMKYVEFVPGIQANQVERCDNTLDMFSAQEAV